MKLKLPTKLDDLRGLVSVPPSHWVSIREDKGSAYRVTKAIPGCLIVERMCINFVENSPTLFQYSGYPNAVRKLLTVSCHYSCVEHRYLRQIFAA